MNFVIQSSDPALSEYINSIDADLDLPIAPYSNIENGLGIFAMTRRSEIKGYTLDYKSLDSLVHGRYTKHLKFVGW